MQLELLTPEEVVPLIMAPSDYTVPANVGWLYEQGLDITEVGWFVFRDVLCVLVLFGVSHTLECRAVVSLVPRPSVHPSIPRGAVCVCVPLSHPPSQSQVAKELGIPYEDQEYLLEPEHASWTQDVAFDMGKDAADLGEFLYTVRGVCVWCSGGRWGREGAVQ